MYISPNFYGDYVHVYQIRKMKAGNFLEKGYIVKATASVAVHPDTLDNFATFPHIKLES